VGIRRREVREAASRARGGGEARRSEERGGGRGGGGGGERGALVAPWRFAWSRMVGKLQHGLLVRLGGCRVRYN
jgi:hypothetical protein